MPATPFTAAPAPRRILAAVLTLGVLCGATTVMADTTDMVRDGIRACFANKEKVRAAKKPLQALGWQSEGIFGDMWFFQTKAKDGIATIGAASWGSNACGFGVKKMTAAQSTALAAGMAKELMGKSAVRLSDADAKDMDAVAVWVLERKTTADAIVVAKEVNYPNYYRGSIIYVVFIE
ncbi:MAG: hypothetical protein KDE08_10750 [Rhodobacteraceae bacterium]|nr:hypothetical protein [Paracoccaceae bacterium]